MYSKIVIMSTKGGVYMRKTLQVSQYVKDMVDQLKDLYGFKTQSELLAFVLSYHIEKVQKDMPALDYMEYARMARESK